MSLAPVEAFRRASAKGAPRVVAFAIGAVLLALAALAVWRHRDALAAADASLRNPPPWAVAALPLSVLASILIGGVILKRLLRMHPTLPLGELAALVAASSLFNLLPLKPGLAGRIAWQRRHQGVAIPTLLRASVATVLLSMAAVATGIAAVLLSRQIAVPAAAGLAATAVLLLALCRLRSVGVYAELLWWRLLDLGAWSIRIAAAFEAIGLGIDADGAIALACVAMATGAVPVIGSAIGVREWAVALLAPLLAGVAWENALAAELLGRAVEVLVLLPAGLGASWWLWRAARRAKAP